MKKQPDDLSIAQHFWGRVDIGSPDACWEWMGPRVRPRQDYGKVSIRGRQWIAHRFAYVLTHPDVELDRATFVCHRCDNPPCCNPAHLFLGTHQENMADMARKGRSVSPSTRLTDEQVAEIRRRRAAREPALSIARDFGITRQYVSQLALGRWRQRGLA